jgi:glycine cleavage system aminomethyltransferase T
VSDFDPSQLVRDYGNPREEAQTCRTSCALFDFSFVKRARISEEQTLAILAEYQPRNLNNLQPGRIAYSARLNHRLHVKSDLTIWRLSEYAFEVMSGRPQDIAELKKLCGPNAEFQDLSNDTAVFAIQGPATLEILNRFTDISPIGKLPYFGHCKTDIADIICRVGRIGYTGERGIEIIVPQQYKHQLWEVLSAHITPAGFAAADILRIEAGFILFTNECLLGVTTTELGIDHLIANTTDSPRCRLVSFRADCAFEPILWQPEASSLTLPKANQITVTSACHSVVVPSIIGLGFVEAGSDDDSLVDPTGVFQNIQRMSHPFTIPRNALRARIGSNPVSVPSCD